jgi:hypothetical protein
MEMECTILQARVDDGNVAPTSYLVVIRSNSESSSRRIPRLERYILLKMPHSLIQVGNILILPLGIRGCDCMAEFSYDITAAFYAPVFASLTR